MRDKRLHIYLNDHLALLVAETQLAARCRRSNRATPLGEFLDQLHTELSAQQSVVRDVLRRLGSSESSLKQGAAWFAEKLGRFKLNDTLLRYSKLSRVLELEALAATGSERLALWDNLEAVASKDERLKGITFAFFRDQSRRHLEQLDRHRRYAAVQAFLED